MVSKLFKKGSINFLAKRSGLQFFKKVSFIQFTFITLSQVLLMGIAAKRIVLSSVPLKLLNGDPKPCYNWCVVVTDNSLAHAYFCIGVLKIWR